jgi:uncharacterized damage-inducible protein DinB
MDRSLIDQYSKGGDDLRMAVRGLLREDLLAFPVPGTWSIQQIVIHLLDSDLVLAERMKRVIAENNPPLLEFDENLFVKRLFYDEQSIEDALAIFEINRRNFARVLAKLPDSAFDRIGTHSKRGPMKLADILTGSVKHLKHHMNFIVSKREQLGKMMW